MSSFAMHSKVSVNFVVSETAVKKLCSNVLVIDSGRLLASLVRSCDKRFLAIMSETLLSFVNFLD
jgi:hypothetical protein